MSEDERLEQLLEEEDTLKGKYLTFLIGCEEYGIEIRFVTEIIGGMQMITQVPETADYVKGIINLRGKIIPVIDVNLRFKKEAKEYNDRTCIIVVDIDTLSVGLIVDNVAEVLSISDDNIVPPPDARAGFHHRYISGIGKVGTAVKLLLDCKKLLSDEDLNTMREMTLV